MTPPRSPGTPQETSDSPGRGHTWVPDPSISSDAATRAERGRWAAPLLEAAPRPPGPDDEPPTEPNPVTEEATPSDAGRMRHLRALDGLRGVAVLAVVMYHFAGSIVPGGFLGVDLFFVLSGFLITSLLVNEWGRTTHLSLRAFWGRRARRLLPALLLVLGAVGAYTLFVGSHVDAEHIAQDGLSALLYVANWHFISSGQSYIQQFVHSAPSPLRHMWSLAIEEQFYLIWPLVVLVVATVVPKRARWRGRQISQFRIWMVVVCGTLAVLSFIRMVTLYHGASDVNRVYYGTDSRAFVILVGAALGALSMGAPTVSGRARHWLIVAGCWGAVALLAAFAWTTTSSSYLYRGAYGLVALVMVLVLAAAAQPGENRLARILSTRPLVGLGLISYGVYLWHWPITVWVTPQTLGVGGVVLFFVRCAIMLAAALASFFLVEQPIRRGHLPGSFLKNPGVVPMVLVTAVAVVLLIPALAYPSLRTAPTSGGTGVSLDAVTREYGAAPRCDNAAPAASISPGRELRVQLVGNSIAQEIRSCLGTILRARGATLEGVSPFGFNLCLIIPAVEKQLANPKTRPNVAIWFALDSLDPDCGPKATFETPVLRLLKAWKADGVHVFLVPAIPPVGHSDAATNPLLYPYADQPFYNAMARKDPTGITVLDAGPYLRSGSGVYQWRMPCLPDEPGCSADDTVGVRWTDGFHYCTYAPFGAEHNYCPSPPYQAGERRAAAGLASALLPKLTALFPPRRRDGS